MLKKQTLFILFAFCILLSAKSLAQELSNKRSHQYIISSDTITLDSLSIIPGSFFLADSTGQKIDSTLYILNTMNSTIIISQAFREKHTTFKASYKVFPVSFSKNYFHKDYDKAFHDVTSINNPFIYNYTDKTNDIFKTEGLNKNGSISRGISFGNNQDVIVNSSLNLQLSGKLSDNINILAAITDNNIPIQPDGNTQQIQEFDKVFIQLYNQNSKLIAGDFELQRPHSYFMNLYKKSQGGYFSTTFLLPKKEKDIAKQTKITSIASAAISKGKYTRNTINVLEGNQGPYKLHGSNNESYIIVIAGTEKVYIDGQMMVRGQSNDYVIDYNTAEVTFTPKNFITKDKRVMVEFEYSDKNFVRSLFFVGEEIEKKNVKIRFNFFSEQDSKNQPIQQSLTNEQKNLLGAIGDSIELAVASNVDSILFNNNEVLYKKIDTLVLSVLYDSVYVYCTNADSAHYRLGFTNVGQGFGNYIQIKSSANGRVFEWVAPVGAVKQGSFEPVLLLVTPKKKQLFTVAADWKISKNTFATIESAISNNDINTFSGQNDNDNIGYAATVKLVNKYPFYKTDSTKWTLITKLSNEWVYRDFSPIERYREVEFERNWNMGNLTIHDNENIGTLQLTLFDKKTGTIGYQFSSYLKGSEYNGMQHAVNGLLRKKGFELAFDGSLLQTKGLISNTAYLKQKVSLSKYFKHITIGVKEEEEHNEFREKNSDTLQITSFAFKEYQAFIKSPDSTKNKFLLNYKKRFDFLPENNRLNQATIGESINATLDLIKNSKNRLNFTASYRMLSINDTSLTIQKDDDNVVGRIEYYLKLFKSTISFTTYYEIGSGMEIKKEFSYVEVAQGQGVYMWSDYNENGIKELNEFEIAAFQDQANYIRIYTPTNDYIKTFSNQFTETFLLNPAVIWSNKKGVKKILSRFSNQTTYRIDSKTNNIELMNAYNPFVSGISDTSLIFLNSSFRTSTFFNRSNAVIGMDYSYQTNNNKILLTNGFESRSLVQQTIKIRWNIAKKFLFTIAGSSGIKSNKSDYFSSKDYNLFTSDAEPMFSFQKSTSFRLSLSYKYSEKKNSWGTINEKAILQKSGIEVRYNVLSKSSFLLKANYILISYNASENTSIAYEMLEGLKKGSNATWNITFQRNISNNLQLNLVYDGRKSSTAKMVHIGTVQLRASF